MIDKAVVVVSGQFGSALDVESAALLFSEYAHVLTERVQPGANRWKAPRGEATGELHIETNDDPLSTIAGAKLKARLALSEVALRLSITANPTRTLRHKYDSSPRPSLCDLRAMAADDFFKASPCLSQMRGLDGEDNVLPATRSLPKG